ncbi:ABC transporter ATP-binding protein [Candidatus Contubernalis alkaliaceticus]|uniref:ABC transporter ATP-binding protein n=1 Tax=Candidatus Contubernalis alkaliaceticus TaxID=338645 RepID=UPI001F4BE90C|nr:ABC transporter ATP-binding protein [Candidatus Contubernalis alkalaceticus]UNC91169.1 ABC transporter ATP-binding protein [Candidatus Contubernalis alkalaceticus]
MFLEVNQLTKIYHIGDVPFRALNKVSFSMEKGQVSVILGPSGSGKTTVVNIIGGIDSADEGRVTVKNTEITSLSHRKLTEYRRDSIGFVFQFYNLIPNLTVAENIEVASNISKDPMETSKILKSMDMSGLENRFPRELSGGQQQRVSIARALVKNPELLLCDEPTGSLDYKSSKDILTLIEQINQEFGTNIIIITHNQAIAAMAHRVIHMRSGEITRDITQEAVPAERIEW